MDDTPMLITTLAAMAMRRVHVSDEDLELLERSVRAFALVYRTDAKRQGNPTVRDRFEQDARNCERLAERVRRFRE